MLDSLPPGTAPATDIVSSKVLINGTVLSNEVLLSQVSVSKSFNKVAYAKLVFLDGSASDRDFALSNDDNYKPGNTIEIQLGYDGNTDTIFKGIIVKHGIKIRQEGASLLLIEAKDEAIKLTGARKSAYYIDKSDSDVIGDLAGALDKDVESTSLSHKQLVQYDATDWDFIVTRAEANGMLVFTDNGKLTVKKPESSGDAVLTATYGQNIREFEAEMDARRQVAEVKSHSWDYTQQQLEESDPGSAQFTENGNISSDDLGNVLDAHVQLSHTGNLTAPQLQNWSDAYALRNHLSKAVGRVRVEGNSEVKPGSMISLEGVGDRFNGNVFVTGVLHSFDGTWQSDLQFGWREELFYKKEDVIEKPAAGLLPGIHGLQIGIVQDVDDPDGQFRVKVHVPTFTSGNEGLWARVCTLDAGSNRGSYFRPEVSDEVILGFLDDDPREPIILGYLHSKDNKSSPLPQQQGNLEFGFVTKEGLKIVMDDTNKKMTLTVPGAAGDKTITINDSSGAMELKDENQNSIKMDSSGITIQASLNVVIKGATVMIN